MLQNPCKTLGFKKNMVYKIPPRGGGGKLYPASGLCMTSSICIAFGVTHMSCVKNVSVTFRNHLYTFLKRVHCRFIFSDIVLNTV